jgi:uncharacterized membrane protein
VSPFADRRLLTLFGLAALTTVSLVLATARSVRTGEHFYDFLAWNLLLAWVPLVLALALYDAYRRHAATPLLLALGAGWLLFLPNAPYIVTDYVHLTTPRAAPFWFDMLLVSTAAWTGLALGTVSLLLVHLVLRSAIGRGLAWAGVVAALASSAFGVYLGRFVRLNSWDVVARPRAVADQIAGIVAKIPDRPHIVGAALAAILFAAIAYALVYSLVVPPPRES